jgi:hypothetical protein
MHPYNPLCTARNQNLAKEKGTINHVNIQSLGDNERDGHAKLEKHTNSFVLVL